MADTNGAAVPTETALNLFSPPADPPPAVVPKPVVRSVGTKPTPPTNQADMSPQQRWQADQDERTRNDAWLDTSKVLTRDVAGNLVQRELTTDPNGEPTAGKPLNAAGAPEPDADAAPPASGDDVKVKIGDTEFTQKQWLAIAARQAAQDLKLAQVPATADGYKIELPKDFVPPAGMIFELAAENDPLHGPSFQMARQWAREQGLTQEGFSKLVGLYASITATEQAAIHARAKAEAESLGANGPARTNAIAQFLRANFGDAKAQPMLMTLSTRSQVEIWENIIGRLTNQGSAGFTGRGREPDGPASPTDDQWNRMSYSQQVEYAAAATARARQNGGRRR